MSVSPGAFLSIHLAHPPCPLECPIGVPCPPNNYSALVSARPGRASWECPPHAESWSRVCLWRPCLRGLGEPPEAARRVSIETAPGGLHTGPARVAMVNTRARWLHSALCQGRHGDCKGWLLPRTSPGCVSMVILARIFLSHFLALVLGPILPASFREISPEDATRTRGASAVPSVCRCRRPQTPRRSTHTRGRTDPL